MWLIEYILSTTPSFYPNLKNGKTWLLKNSQIWFDKVKENKSYFYKCISYLDIISGPGLSHGESSTVHWSIGFKIQDPEYSDLSDFLRLFLQWIFSSCSHFVFDKRLLPKAPFNNMVFALVAFDKLVSDKLFKQN